MVEDEAWKGSLAEGGFEEEGDVEGEGMGSAPQRCLQASWVPDQGPHHCYCLMGGSRTLL